MPLSRPAVGVMSRVVLVTGSREWSESAPIVAAILGDACAWLVNDERVEAQLVIHGAADGADALAAEAAVRYGVRQLPIPAPWGNGWKGAGPWRNQRLVDIAVELRALGHRVVPYAFPLPSSRGTYDCISRLNRAAFDVAVCNIAENNDRPPQRFQ